nr:arabinose kinase [Tanacetum cinerariifolium]
MASNYNFDPVLDKAILFAVGNTLVCDDHEEAKIVIETLSLGKLHRRLTDGDGERDPIIATSLLEASNLLVLKISGDDMLVHHSVMDRMASACGEANKLLAMVCKPAVVLGLVTFLVIYGFGESTQAFKALLTSVSSEEQPTALSELIYSACGLGSDGMDRLVQLVQEMHHREPSFSGTDRLVQLVQETQHRKPSVSGMEPYTGQKSWVVDPVAPFMGAHSPKTGPNPNWSKMLDQGPDRNGTVWAFKALLTSVSSEEQPTALSELMYKGQMG